MGTAHWAGEDKGGSAGSGNRQQLQGERGQAQETRQEKIPLGTHIVGLVDFGFQQNGPGGSDSTLESAYFAWDVNNILLTQRLLGAS